MRYCSVIGLWLLIGAAATTAATPLKTPEEFLNAGETAYQQGQPEQALHDWQQAAALQKEQRLPAYGETLIRIAEAHQALGQYEQAVLILEQARVLLEANHPDQNSLARVTGSLGNAYFLAGNNDKAEIYLISGLHKARLAKLPAVMAVHLNNLGTLRNTQKRYAEAAAAFIESAKLARQTGQSALTARALLNINSVALEDEDYAGLAQGFPAARQALQQLDDSHEKAYELIALGRQAQRAIPLQQAQSQAEAQAEEQHASAASIAEPANWSQQAAQAFTTAREIARRLHDKRAESYALGYLGQLREQAKDYDPALQLTQQAAFAAQTVDAPEIGYLWHWQQGRIYVARQQDAEAIRAYQHAVDLLQDIRHDLARNRGGNTTAFRDQIAPVYFELADLLLRQPKEMYDQQQFQRNLIQARATVEQLKGAELEDYFQDDCATVLQSKITQLEQRPLQHTAVLYPILLATRTELLLTLPGGVRQYTVPVSRDALTETVRTLRSTLEGRDQDYLSAARQLYDWLIRPLQAALTEHTITTLVIVPDGPLRTIPLAALHDGKQFLIEHYALATTPGITLTDPRPLPQQGIEMLASGLSKGVRDYPALPSVRSELNAVDKFYRSTVLLDEGFVLPKLKNALNQRPHQIVHIATHGQFDSDPRNTFLLTYDDKLTMDRLEQFIRPSQFADQPLELLTLSACQTAAGDDRAALGLAGIAIRAGARSAVASLWSVNDESTALLMTEFYRQLKSQPQLSKAQVFQQAQLRLLDKRSKYRHPFYWSPFLLIGNWL